MTRALVAALLLAAGLATPAGRAAVLLDWRGRRAWTAVVLAVILTAGFAAAARYYVDGRMYLFTVLVSAAGFYGLYLLAINASSFSSSFADWLLARNVMQLAVLAAIASVAVNLFLLDGVPHVDDELAYIFQARALSAGRLAQPAGPEADAFTTAHTLVWHGRWFGIMNPGWPLLLAPGLRAGVPWLVNPLLGIAAVAAFGWYCRETGLPERVGLVAALVLIVSPFTVIMNASFMSHSADLALFLLFGASWMRYTRSASLPHAIIAGSCLTLGILVRPIDTVVVLVPFAVVFLWQVRSRPRLLIGAGVVAAAGLLGVGLTLANNYALTGDATMMPTTLYFDLRNPAERFGIGFGADMGTKLHGGEWPGFYPSDAVRVSAYRATEFLDNVLGAPLLVMAALVGTAWWRASGASLMAASAFAIAALYFFHFYHGIAYGARHFYLALPAVALAVAHPVGAWLESGAAEVRLRAKAAITAAIGFLLLFALPPRIREYGERYRGVDGAVRDTVARSGLSNALVFVGSANWAWKAAFPLNDYPLASNSVLMARDRGADNARVMAAFPGRAYYRLTVGNDGRVALTPMAAADSMPRR